jgi:hypothetical protein
MTVNELLSGTGALFEVPDWESLVFLANNCLKRKKLWLTIFKYKYN